MTKSIVDYNGVSKAVLSGLLAARVPDIKSSDVECLDRETIEAFLKYFIKIDGDEARRTL